MKDLTHNLIGKLAHESAAGFNDEDMASKEKLPCWENLRERGTELWLDTGDISQASAIWNGSFSGLTTNNTLINKEVQKGIYTSLSKMLLKCS
ncbi:MAG: hypothetical protein A2020_10645 [Lentisphaerae bacterium GWF2_45_14]|nr:MAG: hypothetical protein A2020_10645 [Lentisphaerae bacterium GWF2_45_14]